MKKNFFYVLTLLIVCGIASVQLVLFIAIRHEWRKMGYDNIPSTVNELTVRVDSMEAKTDNILLAIPRNVGFIGTSHNIWCHVGNEIAISKSSEESCESADMIQFDGTSIKLNQYAGRGKCIMLFADDNNRYLGALDGDGSDVYEVVPPAGTTRLFWNWYNDGIHDTPYLEINRQLKVSDITTYMSDHKIVEIPPGEYVIPSSWKIPSNTLLRGVRGGTKLIISEGEDYAVELTDNSHNITFENITFIGSTPSKSRFCIIPSASELAEEQGAPSIGLLSTLSFSAHVDDTAYVPSSSGGSIVKLAINGWKAMDPIAIPKDAKFIVPTFKQGSGQRCCTFVDEGNTKFSILTLDEIGKECAIPSWAKYIYWSVSTSNNPDLSLCNIKFYGIDDEVSNECGIYIHGDARSISILNCDFYNFGCAGIKLAYTLEHSYVDKPIIEGCRFFNNWNGIVVSERGEFCRIVNCEFADNQIGVWTMGANTTITACSFVKNYMFGLVMAGGSVNSIHTLVSNCEIVHNGYNKGNVGKRYDTYDIVFTKVVAGISVVGCLIGVDGIMCYHSQGLLISGCQLICPIYLDGATGMSNITGNMWRKHGKLGTIINGATTNVALNNNRFTNGDDERIINNKN